MFSIIVVCSWGSFGTLLIIIIIMIIIIIKMITTISTITITTTGRVRKGGVEISCGRDARARGLGARRRDQVRLDPPPQHWGNTNRVVSNRVVSKGPLYPSETKIICCCLIRPRLYASETTPAVRARPPFALS